jgi:hypothetical protein
VPAAYTALERVTGTVKWPIGTIVRPLAAVAGYKQACLRQAYGLKTHFRQGYG